MANDLTDKKCVADVYFHFKLELTTLVFLSVPTNKNPRERDHRNVWQHLENCLRTYTCTDTNIFPCIGKGSSLLKFVQAFHVHSVPGVILHSKTLSFGTACLCVSHDSYNKQQLFLQTT